MFLPGLLAVSYTHLDVYKRQLIPCPEAGCSLAESCDARDFAAFKARYPGHTVVSYVNTTVGVKALTDICCTSSNALKVVESIPADRPVIFAPDRNPVSYTHLDVYKRQNKPIRPFISTRITCSA